MRGPVCHALLPLGLGLHRGEPLPLVWTHPVSTGYFRTLGARITQGREFTEADEDGEGRVVEFLMGWLDEHGLVGCPIFGAANLIGHR